MRIELKKLALLLSIVTIAAASNLEAKGFKYQAVVRNALGEALSAKSVTVQVTIRRDSPTGAGVYSETHSTKTDNYGLINIGIGAGSTASGSFDDIEWGLYDCFLEVSIDDGSGFSVIGTTQILSVPLAIFALDAKTAVNADTAKVTIAADSAGIAKTALTVKQENDPLFMQSLAAGITPSDTTRWAKSANVPTKVGELENDAGYISSEKDSTFLRSPANAVSWGDIETWKLAYSWGDHKKAGYMLNSDFQAHPASSITAEDKNRWSMAYNWGDHADAGYLKMEKDSSVTNELQVLTISNDTIYLSNGGFAKLPSGFSSNFRDLTNIPSKLDTNYTDDFDGNYSSLSNAPDIANTTLNKTIQLSTSDNTTSLSALNSSFTNIFKVRGDGKVGIMQASPRSTLEVGGTDGLIVTGTPNTGTVQALGSGCRLQWYPRKGAFRAGYAESNWWDDDGSSNPRLALYSVGMGYQPRASGSYSTAIGSQNKATGDYSLALGSYSWATGSHSIAIGTMAEATGIYSIAIGSGASTNGKDGAMVIGDDTWFQTAYASCDNELTMRFSGGYRLWSSYPDSVSGVYMRGNQSGWSNYCDRNLKENFREPDNEALLKSIENMPVTEWNYKSNKETKYMGPVAQDFFSAFHLGGDDSLGINSICIDGVNMAGVKALIKRTNEANKEIEILKQQNCELNKKLNLLLEKAGINTMDNDSIADAGSRQAK